MFPIGSKGPWQTLASPVPSENELKLSDLELSDVKLSGVKLSDVKLSGVKLSGVKLSGVKLSGVKLRMVKKSERTSTCSLAHILLTGTTSLATNNGWFSFRFCDQAAEAPGSGRMSLHWGLLGSSVGILVTRYNRS